MRTYVQYLLSDAVVDPETGWKYHHAGQKLMDFQ